MRRGVRFYRFLQHEPAFGKRSAQSPIPEMELSKESVETISSHHGEARTGATWICRRRSRWTLLADRRLTHDRPGEYDSRFACIHRTSPEGDGRTQHQHTCSGELLPRPLP